MKIRILCIALLVLGFVSCGEYNKVLKSNDPELKYSYATKYFDEKKYSRTYTLIEEIMPVYIGLSKEEELRFLLAQAYFYNKEYDISTIYYTQYFNKYPKGNYAELARFNSALGLYYASPEAQLDQTNTVKSIQGFQGFLEYFPQSDKAKEAESYMFELQEKLAKKELMAATLYFNLGLHRGNNYEACVVTAKEALKSYPYSIYADEIQYLIVKARYELASQSIEDKKPVRYRELLDEYYNYLNMFPQGRFVQDIERYNKRAQKYLNLGEESDADDSETPSNN